MNLQLGRAIGIVMKTMPYVFYRAVVYGVICAAVALVLLFVALVGRLFGGAAAGVMILILLGVGTFGVRLVREYILYLLRAGHIAVITEIIERGDLPKGVSQTQWGADQVKTYFKEISVLALIDQIVKGVIIKLNRTLFNVMTILPIPGMKDATKVVQKVVDFSLTYVDEAILAHTFKTRNPNVYGAAKSGVILYCQAWKGLLKNAVVLTLLSYVGVVISALIFLIPLGAVAWMLPETWGVAKFVLFLLALFMGASLKWILFDPIACASTILTFLAETRDMTPDPTWEERIERVSDKFRELKHKASEYVRNAEAAESAAAETTPSDTVSDASTPTGEAPSAFPASAPPPVEEAAPPVAEEPPPTPAPPPAPSDDEEKKTDG